ncbi:phage tail protein [bacterium (Candidatus Blackallbacteria) CG13_big_fil_rev_8_21_14_2_50_49_14]|nr:MAG: phage tail protein [bacterium (Candidatus Blackallbacteria) CG18_big_fil_WC_8_21_14_2_50_49_26]PIW46646.1 MAG: phage tail protein [bacterium (Candidatus Blackallbacteria) CG13_big_fil_rev_8_21_14_2_50_49_14]
MAVNYLHGVETIEVDKGPRPIRTVKTAVVGLIGSAPMGAVNTPTVVLSDRDAAAFGPQTPNFTIPQALNAIFDQGYGTVIVINVLDPAVHKTAVAAEAQTFGTDGTLSLAHPHIANLVLKNTGGTVTYVKDTDYSVDPVTGKVTRIPTGDITAGQAIEADYDYADPTKVLASDIIGGTSVGGQRSGIQALDDTYNLFGYFAKILISPVFCTQNSVAVELIAMAQKLKAIALIDAPIGTTPAQAIAGRGPAGTINFNTSSERAYLCYPHLKVYDTVLNAERLEPYSQRLAGVMCRRDVENGYWWSPSNLEILGITGSEFPISARVNDPNTEANQLNEAGICTVFNSFGTGLRTWGNRSAAWPSVTSPKNFVSVRRTADVLHESIEFSMLQFIDYPIDDVLIDAIIQSANAFVRTLIGRGAIVDGEVTYDPAKNPPTEIALGHLTFDVTFIPPTPAERITFESFLDINLLAGLGAAA